MTERTRVMVIGGAGYVGSHVALALSQDGFEPVTYDDLSGGHAGFVRWGPLERGDVRDAGALEGAIRRHGAKAVINLAAEIEVGRSVRDPNAFYSSIAGGAVAVVEAMRRTGVGAAVLSSSCAVYGAPLAMPIPEDHPRQPASPYGRAKLMAETILEDAAAYGIRAMRLRYFNAAGADPEGRIGEAHEPETHLLPIAIAAARGLRGPVRINGTRHPTPDGTCIRDYVHVLDLARAHVGALEHLLGGGASTAVNLGTGRGTSVRELLAAVGRAVGRPVPHAAGPARPGDAAELVADSARARTLLGWTARHGLEDVVRSAVNWHMRAEGPDEDAARFPRRAKSNG